MTWNRFKEICANIDALLDKIGTILIVLGGVAFTLAVLTQIMLRYVFKAPLFGVEEFSILIAMWVYFIGAIYATKLDSHIQGDLAERLFRKVRHKAVVKIITWCLSLGACLLFIYHGSKYCIWVYVGGEKTAGLWWPRIYSISSIFFGAVFMTIYSTANIVKYLTLAVKGSNSEQNDERG